VADQIMASTALLTELRAAHCEVLECIAEMERITNGSMPDVTRYTAARFRISKASLERRSLWQGARRHLESKATPTDCKQLERLAAIDLELGSHSADHVRRWTRDAIEGDWAGYREASRKIRHRMRDCIEAEKRILYPLLARYS
jgi:hypothetical protein